MSFGASAVASRASFQASSFAIGRSIWRGTCSPGRSLRSDLGGPPPHPITSEKIPLLPLESDLSSNRALELLDLYLPSGRRCSR